jgi:acetyltransferase-like isoleucine patch superfamily enzyme
MKKITESVISRTRKSSFKLDESLSDKELFVLISNRIFYIIRGIIKRMGLKSCGKILFVGNNVKLKSKSKIQLGNGVTIDNYCVLDALSKDGITIGDNVKIGSYSIIACTGTIRTIGRGVRIGSNSGIGEFCYFGAAGGIDIGENVIMGQNIRFHSENHNYSRLDVLIREQGVTNQGIKIGNDCWIGAGAVFLDGVTVGNGCVIGANTLVNKSIPDYSVAVGNPVKIVKNRKELVK